MPQNISAADFVKVATTTAHHFGFQSLEHIKQSPECKSCGKRIEHKASANDRRIDALHGMLTSGMCCYFDNKLNGIEGPVLFYSTEPVPRSGEVALSLQIFNVKKSIAEALLIQTVRSIVGDLGYSHYSVRVNSLGDTDSVSRYIRELTNYLRKRMDDMPPIARELMKEHPLNALMHLVEKEHDLAFKSPRSLEYLTDTSRKHFREIVEYLDMSQIAYEIDPQLVGNHQCYSEALFAFDVLNEDRTPLTENQLYIRGGRYDTFVSRMSRTNVHAVGAILILKDKKAPARIAQHRNSLIPSVFVVQLGFAPKIKSLLLIDELRHAGIPVYQNVVSDSLSEQLRQAETRKARYAVIVGQKEYIDGTVILRDLAAQSQEYIPATALASRLKRTAKA